jgi:glycosyltransferase involved in cell wall biosynthesis
VSVGIVPLFSVLIPTFNRFDLLQEAIDSVLAQDFQDFEVIVSDNWSADGTREVLEKYTDPRVIITRPPTHVPMPFNWEHARSAATGKYLVPLADDDALVGGALTRFKRCIDKTGAKFMFCPYAEYFDDTFPKAGTSGRKANTIVLSGGCGRDIRIPAREYLSPLYAMTPYFHQHPSSYVIEKTVCDEVVAKFGGLFVSQGVEFFSWPAVLTVVPEVYLVDLPLAVVGRTAKSGGVQAFLENLGGEELAKIHNSWDNQVLEAPVAAKVSINLIAEALWRAQTKDPTSKLKSYGRDEHKYADLLRTELTYRKGIGSDVDRELAELAKWSATLPPKPNSTVQRNRVASKVTQKISHARRARGYIKARVIDCEAEGIHNALEVCRYVEKLNKQYA